MATAEAPANINAGFDNNELKQCEAGWYADSHVTKGENIPEHKCKGHFLRHTCSINEVGNFYRESDVKVAVDAVRSMGVGYVIATLTDNQANQIPWLEAQGFKKLARFKNDYLHHVRDHYMVTLYGLDLEQPGTPEYKNREEVRLLEKATPQVKVDVPPPPLPPQPVIKKQVIGDKVGKGIAVNNVDWFEIK